ncbi:hypothetical protein OVA31_13750 [Gordonia sp. SL306]|nr:hypothetical protein [Gordonia sp. SL306]WAC53776.1 hypothetical protein OVA31_13750 [Gordonia sp. SL306]
MTNPTSATAPQTVYTLTEGARCLLGGGGVAVLLPAKQRLDGLSPGQIATLRTLNGGPLWIADDADADTIDLLDRLVDAGVVSLIVTAGQRDLYSLRPFRRPPQPRPAPCSDAFELSRFTVVRRNGTDVVAEHPRSWCDVARPRPGDPRDTRRARIVRPPGGDPRPAGRRSGVVGSRDRAGSRGPRLRHAQLESARAVVPPAEHRRRSRHQLGTFRTDPVGGR